MTLQCFGSSKHAVFKLGLGCLECVGYCSGRKERQTVITDIWYFIHCQLTFWLVGLHQWLVYQF